MGYVFLVDADDTILDFHGVSDEALPAAFAACGVAWKEEYRAVYRRVNGGLWEMLERKEISRERLMAERFPRFLQALGIASSFGEKMNAFYVRYLSENPRFIEGAETFLRALRKLGRIYIVTNGTAYVQEARFQRLRLSEKTDGAFISEKVGFDKPAAAYTAYVAEHIADFDKRKAVWIGDSLSADIRAANEADILSVWWNPQGKPKNDEIVPNFEARNYSELMKILQGIVQ